MLLWGAGRGGDERGKETVGSSLLLHCVNTSPNLLSNAVVSVLLQVAPVWVKSK